MKRIALLASAALSTMVLIAGSAGVSTSQVRTVVKPSPATVGRSAAAQVPPQMRAWLSHRVAVTRDPHVATRSSVATGFRNPQPPTVQVGGNPIAVAVNTTTNSVYVGNGNDGTVSVVDGTDCNAHNTSGCGQSTAIVQLGNGVVPVDADADVATNTVYVTDVAGNSIFVIDGTICNAHDMAGCGQTPASIVVGSSPDGLVFDQRTHTLYVANANDGTLSVIDTSTCNASNHSGCGQTPPTVRVGSFPGVPALNKATNTLYVPNSGDATVSAVNISACQAGTTSGCGRTPRTISVGPNTFSAAVDSTTNTVYVTSARIGADTNRGSLYVINGATCNATIVSGCRQMPTRVTVGSIPIGVIQDPFTRNVFVLNEEDSSLSILDGAACNAQHLSGCGKPALTLNVGHNGGYFDVNGICQPG